MSVKLTSVTEIRAYDVGGMPPVSMRYSRTGTELIPAKVTVEFLDGEWRSVEIAGPNRKKDGTAGEKWHDNRYSRSWAQQASELPDWAVPFTDFNYRAEG